MTETFDSIPDFNDLSVKSIQLPIDGKLYTLKECSADGVVKFRTRSAQAAKYNAEGNLVGWSGLADVEPFLVSQCLYNEQGGLVPESVIRKWPNKVMKWLFKKAYEMSDIEATKDPVKDQLLTVLSRDDSPVKPAALAEWVEGLGAGDTNGPLIRFLRSRDEEAVKNSSSTTATSSA